MAISQRDLCPAPFYQEDLFPSAGGFIDGRLCQIVPVEFDNLTCCLPCPTTDWTYSDEFIQKTHAANWLNVAALVATMFCLLSFAVLQVRWTHVHYLSICLAIAVVFLEIAFVIPLGTNPEECYNTITPRDMSSSVSCAFSGAFLIFGGWAVVMWVFWRALSLHLQICWEVVPGNRFFYSALVLGWGIPAVGLALAMTLTGVSYRFGNVCHINHTNGLQDFWGPLLAFAAASLIIQGITFGYCLQVYIRSLLGNDPATGASSGIPSYSGSVHTGSRRQAFKRVKQVIQLQWRGVVCVLIIIAEVIFFAVVFVSMDNNLVATETDPERGRPWLDCLVRFGGDKNQCLYEAQQLVEKESTILAVLICLALSGFWLLILLGRWSMVLGWIDLGKRFIARRHEFVSADARRLSDDAEKYTMLHSSVSPPPPFKSPQPVIVNTSPTSRGVTSPNLTAKNSFLGREARYKSPPTSFSSPRPPSLSGRSNRERAATFTSMESPRKE